MTLFKSISLLTFLRLAALASASLQRQRAPVRNGKCTESLIPVSITANNSILRIDPPANQTVLTDFIVRFTSEASNVTQETTQGTFLNKATYKIYTLLCIPTKQDAQNTVELAVHGWVPNRVPIILPLTVLL